MSGAIVKGWCPGAHRPMMSGDGLVVRVRPRLGRITRDQVLEVCTLANVNGNGMIDVTSRANLQIRGVSEKAHGSLLTGLIAAGLVDVDAVLDMRRNVVATPFWKPGDLTDRLGSVLAERLPDLPELPAKFGFALDTGDRPMLADVSADIRVERGPEGLVVHADGAGRGLAVSEGQAVDAMISMAGWFARTGGHDSGRMVRHVAKVTWPDTWDTSVSTHQAPRIIPGQRDQGVVAGVPFGQVAAKDLSDLVQSSGATHLRVLPWRLLCLEGAENASHPGFVFAGDDPLLRLSACPGAPLCPQATVPTRRLARRLAGRTGPLHVSGCTKGCARQTAATLTIVGCDGAYDVIRDGTAQDLPVATGLTEDQVVERFC